MARILIATDAWHPQVNGVVRTLEATVRTLKSFGHVAEVVEPGEHPGIAFPFYPDVRLCLPRTGCVARILRAFRPDHVHVATEGPLGLAVREFCVNNGWRFTTSYHTRFPEYLHTLLGVPTGLTYRYLRWFHAPAGAVMVATPTLAAELVARGFIPPLRLWSRGVDLSLFRPRAVERSEWPRPVLLSVGRVSAEKNLEAFLALPTPGTKVVVGDGPARTALQKKHPRAVFVGVQTGDELARLYAAADLFVFPSRTDTFGLVLLEALACGLPVAAFKAPGAVDVITHPSLGAWDDDLGRAVGDALRIGDRAACVAEAAKYTWEHCTRQFVDNLVPVATS